MASDIWRSDASRTSFVSFWCSELIISRFIVLMWSMAFFFNIATGLDINIHHGPSAEFSDHKLVKPRVFHGRSKREIFHTRENEHKHADIVTVGFEIDGVERILELRLNTDLIPVGYKQRRQHNGGYKTEVPDKHEICHYQGSVRGIPDSWVAISTCYGLKGVIFDGENMHHIHPEYDTIDSNHYIYKHSDLLNNYTCGFNGSHDATSHLRKKRATEIVRGPYNANRQSRYVELVLVIDRKEYMALGEDLHKVYHHCKDIANIINALYTPLNIFIALVGVDVWTESDQIALSSKGDTTLTNFLRYRREMLVKAIPNDNAQLLTRIHFEDGVVGKALKGPICTYEFSGGVSIDHSNIIGIVAATVAHEMGHNFGMEHDNSDCDCPDERCIMAASSGSTSPIHWSSCSLEYLALAFEHGMDYCLRNKPAKLFDSPICGNGFVEPGEQCDCGLKENCDNPCCNSSTCMLHSNASCATGECCDLKTCKPKNAGVECRNAEHECDLSEYCTGQSEFCPKDVFKIDGESCNMGKAFCYQGTCRTHNDQCKLLWGPSGSSSDAQCYNMNNKGTKLGNCGYNRLNSSYIKCDDPNILCGMLHCKHLNERLEFGMESVAILSHSFINNGGKIIACRSAMVDLGLNQVDPGLSPDGAKCAPGKMCVNQKCMPIADLRTMTVGRNICPNNCGGNGVCNSLGHCHCNRGFRPPDCVQPGYGGSDDSGPAEDPNARNDFVTALYIIFLGIIPTISLISFIVWYRKNSPSRPGWKKDILSPYVSNLPCFKNNKKRGTLSPGINRSSNKQLKIPSKNKLMNIFKFSRDNKNNSNINNENLVHGHDNNKIFTINTLSRDKINIQRKNLVSTTNQDVIDCSNNIIARNSLLLPQNDLGNDNKNDTMPIYANVSKVITRDGASGPNKLNGKNCDINVNDNRNVKVDSKKDKNFKDLRLNTRIDFKQLEESPGSSGSAGLLLQVDKNNKPLPFYNKKPPPPPAPPKSNKPKLFK